MSGRPGGIEQVGPIPAGDLSAANRSDGFAMNTLLGAGGSSIDRSSDIRNKQRTVIADDGRNAVLRVCAARFG